MWTYVQKTGELLHGGFHIARGYSGYDNPTTGQKGKNNPELQSVVEVGPIPVGKYFIGAPHDSTTHGPFVLPLKPDPENEMFGRSEFLIHGESKAHPGAASLGCIILNLDVRQEVDSSGDKLLHVISGLAEDTRLA